IFRRGQALRAHTAVPVSKPPANKDNDRDASEHFDYDVSRRHAYSFLARYASLSARLFALARSVVTVVKVASRRLEGGVHREQRVGGAAEIATPFHKEQLLIGQAE